MKAVKTSPKAAYETFPGMTAEEAADNGYVVVETNGDGGAPIYGRYLNTVTGAAMETLADRDERVPVPAGGEPLAEPVTANKGALINPNDPIVHGQDHNPHPDGAQPLDSENKGLADVITGYVPGEPLKPGRKHKG
jgi:hypothetical protein